MKWFRSPRSRQATRIKCPDPRRQQPAVEALEDRLVPAGDILVTAAGPYPQHLFQEYTPSGALVRSVNIPATPGSSFDYARDLVQDPSGKVYVYNGTFTPYLAAYDPASNSWAQSTYAGWSTVSNVSFGGLAEFQNYVYATDMATAGAMQNGVVRFNLADGSATRFGNVDFTDLNVGLDNKLYALAGSILYVYDPISTTLIRKVTLPSADYRGLAVAANGDIYTAAWNNVISRFSATGAPKGSITLNSSNGAPFMFNWTDDIDIAPDGTLAIGTFSGFIARMSGSFTNITYVNTGTNNQVFVTFAPQPSAPPPTVNVGDVSLVEGNAGVNGTVAPFVLSLSAPSNLPVQVNFTTADGTARGGTLAPNSPYDYNSVSGTVVFSPGTTTQVVLVPIYGDTLFEGTETFTLNLSQPVNALLGRAQATCAIIDDDPAPSISLGDVTVTDTTQGTTKAVFPVTLTNGSGTPITVNYGTANGTATAGSDYQAASGTLTIPAGVTQTSISVTVYGNPYWVPDETFTLSLSHPSLGTISRPQATATIHSGLPLPTVSVSNPTVFNVTSGTTPETFTVSLSEPIGFPVSIYYATADGSSGSDYGGAVAGVNYQAASGTVNFAPGQTSQTVTVNVIGNPLYDIPRIYDLNLYPVTSGGGGGGASGGGGAPYATGLGTILSTLPLPSATVDDVTVQNTASGATAAFTVTLSAGSSVPVTINYATAAGTATPGDDYQSVSGTLTFAPGQTSQTVNVNVVGDPYYDGTEVFYLNLSNPLGAGLDRSQATGTILSTIPEPTVSVNDVSVPEWNSGESPATFTVTLSAPCSDPVTVNYATADGTAVAGTDYEATSGTVYFSPGQTTATVNVNIYGNTTVQPDRSFTVNLSDPQNVLLGTSQGTGTILDDDGLPVLSISDASVLEGNTGENLVLFTLTVTPYANHPITVQYDTSDGTATYLGGDLDYIPMHGTLTISANTISETFWVETVGDEVVEPDETFFLTLSNVVGATLGRSQATGTILNDDHAPVVNPGPDQTVNEGAPVQFDASGSSDADGDPLTYSWNFGDGSTGSGATPTHVYADNGVYTATVKVSDGANVTTGTLTVTVLNVPPTALVTGPADGVPGQDQTFTFSATDPSPADQAALFTYEIDWGDGTTQTVQGAGSGVQVDHVFTGTGSFSVTATATDKDNATGPAASQTVSVVTAELQGCDLYVGGTTGDDTITVQPADANGTVDVVVNGQDQGTFVPTGQVVVYGQAGNDVIQVVPLNGDDGTTPLALPVALFGGDGDDTLDARAASGPGVLVGGAGNDNLYGGGGRNILIGGTGADALHGGGADDLVIGSATSFDADLGALAALRSEWARTDADYQARFDHLTGAQNGGLNGSILLTSQTVTDDGAADDLFGDLGQDWFWVAASGPNADRLHDLESGETITNL
jgi:hypothetical protein